MKRKTDPMWFHFSSSSPLLMIMGTTAAIGNGICMPLHFGELIDSVGQNQNDKQVVPAVSKLPGSIEICLFGYGDRDSFIPLYSSAIWFGAKMILEKGYAGGKVMNVILAVLTGSL
ncbi:P-glycoprotein 11 [Actinidia rufa]|uniref:p-glycoprotein 11 n=1 Tax=Actinidia rufa TaxID=165716 RepID=A0A7J0GS76_9ERIC|nr:P-glycoprotein 11 [Actinidia rufa]